MKENHRQCIQDAIDQLNEIIKESNLEYVLDTKRYEDGFQKIETYRVQVVQIVNDYFLELKERYRQHYDDNIKKTEHIKSIFEEIRGTTEELEYYYQALENKNDPVSHEACQEMNDIDLHAMVKSLKEKFTQTVIKQNIQQAKFNQSTQSIDNLRFSLHSFCNLDQPYRPSSPSQQLNISDEFQEQVNTNVFNLEQPSLSSLKISQIENIPPYLHFFQQNSKKLHILDLNKFSRNEVASFQPVSLDINFDLPQFTRSVQDNKGHFYLIGGIINGEKSSDIYRFSSRNVQRIHENQPLPLDHLGQLKIRRSSHGLCYIHPHIYIVGGFDPNNKLVATCETFNVQDGSVNTISPLNMPSSSMTLAAFEQKTIFKFGGSLRMGELSQAIEKYDIHSNQWTVLNPKIRFLYNQHDFRLLSNAGSIQMNEKEILIFGGHYENSSNSNQQFIFEVQDLTQEDSFIIRDINQFPLPQAEGFSNNEVHVFNKTVYALQNIPTDDLQNSREDAKQLLSFTGSQWNTLL